jgi:hypothetical protein
LPLTEAELAGDDLAEVPGHSLSWTRVSNFADAPFKNAVVQIGCGKFVAKLFVKVLENTTISGLHGSEILG